MPRVIITLLPFKEVFKNEISLAGGLFGLVGRYFSQGRAITHIGFRGATILIRQGATIRRGVIITALMRSTLNGRGVGISFRLFAYRGNVFGLLRGPFFHLYRFVQVIVIGYKRRNIKGQVLLFTSDCNHVFGVGLIGRSPITRVGIEVTTSGLAFGLGRGGNGHLIRVNGGRQVI